MDPNNNSNDVALQECLEMNLSALETTLQAQEENFQVLNHNLITLLHQLIVENELNTPQETEHPGSFYLVPSLAELRTLALGFFSTKNENPRITYQTDLRLIQELHTLKRTLREREFEARIEKGFPLVFLGRKERKAFEDFLKAIKGLPLDLKIPRASPSERHLIMIGPVSCGKSSLANALLEANVKVGLGGVTREAEPVITQPAQNFVLWDYPGVERIFSFLDVNKLAFIKAMDLVFILYKDNPFSIKAILQVLYNLGSKIVLVRTHGDRFPSNHSLQKDKEIVKTFGVSDDIPFFTTSKQGGFDNDKVRQLVMYG